jgi:SNF2 family DNA or RNA helicase
MPSVEIVDRTIRVQAPFEMKHYCTAVPGGKWVPGRKAWEYQLTPATANAIVTHFGKHLAESKAYETLLLARTVFDQSAQIKSRDAEAVPMDLLKTTPWQHQKTAYHFASSILFNPAGIGGGVLLALDMGCGKTMCAISLIVNNLDKAKKVLIVCPNSVVNVWPAQFDRHTTAKPMIVALNEVGLGKKVTVERKMEIAKLTLRAAAAQQETAIIVINYESLWREPFASWSLGAGFDMVVLDEIHRIKAAGGKTTKFCERIGRDVPYRLGLTGTPLPHSPLDIYGQYRFLDTGIFGTAYTKFRSDYAVMGGFQGHQIISFKNLDTLASKMYSIGFRVMSKDVFDLPPFIDETREFSLEPDERSMYRDMETNFCVALNDGMVTADNALVKLLRLQEITSGYLDGQQIGTGKKKLLADLMEDFNEDEPIVIFARFTKDLENIKEVTQSQGRKYAELSGHANELAKWQQGHADVLGVQIKSGREGVDFTRSRYCIYYSLGYSLGDYNQSRARLDRPGQQRSGVYYHLIAKRTIDEVVMKALANREEVVESVLKHYKS